MTQAMTQELLFTIKPPLDEFCLHMIEIRTGDGRDVATVWAQGQQSNDAFLPVEGANSLAMLFAAAPDLLAACEGLLSCQCHEVQPGEACPHVKTARAAIAKATGVNQ